VTRKLAAGAAWLALYGVAWSAGMLYIASVAVADGIRRWKAMLND
jgi:hypothetical protein